MTTQIVCCVCGSAEWLGCAPGTEAEERQQGNLLLLNPAPEIPLKAWCAKHHAPAHSKSKGDGKCLTNKTKRQTR